MVIRIDGKLVDSGGGGGGGGGGSDATKIVSPDKTAEVTVSNDGVVSVNDTDSTGGSDVPITDLPSLAAAAGVPAATTLEEIRVALGLPPEATIEVAIQAAQTPKFPYALLRSGSAAPAFSPSTTYAVGALVTHDGILYECVTAHSGTWSNAHFSIQPVSSLIASLVQACDLLMGI